MHRCEGVLRVLGLSYIVHDVIAGEERRLDKATPEGQGSAWETAAEVSPAYTTPPAQDSGSQEGGSNRPGTLEPGAITVGSRSCVASESGS